MRLTCIALVLCCVWLAAGDVAHLKAAKAKLVGRLANKHHKRGVLHGVPPFKLGYDIPVVTHSVVKPLVVSYPPTAAVTAVKVPLAHPLANRYPVPVGHKVPVPHPHYGLKFPHHTKTVLLPKPDHHFHHHHHHVEPKPVVPVVPAPVPVPATPLVPVGEPTRVVGHPVPPSGPSVLLQPAPVAAPAPAHLIPAPPVHILPPEHVHLKPVAPAPVAIQPAPVLPPITPLLPYANQFPYVLRPGNAVQTSFFANYPRYPLFNYQSPLIPLPPPSVSQVVYERPQVPLQLLPQGQEGVVIEPSPVPVEHQHAVHLQPTQPTLHLQPQPVHLQPDVHYQHVHPDVHLQTVQPDVHLHQAQGGVFQSDVHLHQAQPGHLQPDVHLHSAQPAVFQPDVHYHAEPGVLQVQPDIHLQSGQHDIIGPGQPDVHVHAAQPGILQQPDIHLHSAQPGLLQPGQQEVHLHAQPGVLQPTQPTIPQVDHDGWSPVQTQSNDLGTQVGSQFDHGGQFGADGQYANNAHHQFTQEQGTQVYEHHSGTDQYNDYQNQLQSHIQQQIEQAQYEQHLNNQQHQINQEYGAPHLTQDFGQSNQDFSQHGQGVQDYSQQNFSQQDYSQQNFSQQDYSQGQDYNGQPGQEYGVPQGAEGRSAEGGDDGQLYHNHIPLGLQPPLDRPLEHFR